MKLSETTEGFMPYTDEQKEYINALLKAFPHYDLGFNNDMYTLHEGGLSFEIEVNDSEELPEAVDKIVEISQDLGWQFNFSSVGHYKIPLKARWSAMPMKAFKAAILGKEKKYKR